MISFVSTFPPIICGIGTYTKYLVENIPQDKWRVISFDLNNFSTSEDKRDNRLNRNVSYCLSFPQPCLPEIPRGTLVWFQHAFGMWGDKNDYFLETLKQAKKLLL